MFQIAAEVAATPGIRPGLGCIVPIEEPVMSYIDDLLPFPIRMIEFETVSVLWFERLSEIQRHFELSEPIDADDFAEIVRIGREGIVHATISPFMEEIHCVRRLLLADSAQSLAFHVMNSLDDI